MQNRTPGGDAGLRARRAGPPAAAGAGPPAPGSELKLRAGTRRGTRRPYPDPCPPCILPFTWYLRELVDMWIDLA